MTSMKRDGVAAAERHTSNVRASAIGIAGRRFAGLGIVARCRIA
jgi:hypothetical protein